MTFDITNTLTILDTISLESLNAKSAMQERRDSKYIAPAD
ncbi:hypothetical protein ROBYS_11730 [Roseobacter sp. OBYS 0001]|nr:hypothetical protein ROBYS_11730 [Roseobacter sp. OBYS 0001]